MNKTHMIIFHDKTTLQVTEFQANSILSKAVNQDLKTIQIGLSMVAFSAIAKIQPLESYYEDYPEKRPNTLDQFKQLPDPKQSFYERNKNNYSVTKGLLDGLGKFIREKGEQNVKPATLKMYKKLKKIIINRHIIK